MLQFVHAGNHFFCHQLNMVHDVLLGGFRVEQAYRHLVEPQVPVPRDLLYALIGTADDEGVVHQGFQVSGYLAGHFLVVALEPMSGVLGVFPFKSPPGFVQSVFPIIGAEELPDNDHILGNGVAVFLERLMV